MQHPRVRVEQQRGVSPEALRSRVDDRVARAEAQGDYASVGRILLAGATDAVIGIGDIDLGREFAGRAVNALLFMDTVTVARGYPEARAAYHEAMYQRAVTLRRDLLVAANETQAVSAMVGYLIDTESLALGKNTLIFGNVFVSRDWLRGQQQRLVEEVMAARRE